MGWRERELVSVVEGGFSLTGGMADHRLATRAVDVGVVAMKLAAELVTDSAELGRFLFRTTSTSIGGAGTGAGSAELARRSRALARPADDYTIFSKPSNSPSLPARMCGPFH